MQLEINDNQRYNYGLFILEPLRMNPQLDLLENKKPKKRRWNLDCAFVSYLMREIHISETYRHCFVEYNCDVLYPDCKYFTIVLEPTRTDLIDYRWNERTNRLAAERLELDRALSLLSTLGGAFSALGDYFPACAETAGRISCRQLMLALRLRDPPIQARCRLYFALSLIQRGRLRIARRILEGEYRQAKGALVVDTRLLNMCKGIWSRLQYEYTRRRKR